MSNALVTHTAGELAAIAESAHNDYALIKATHLPEGTDQQFRLLVAFGHAKGLDLVTKQYYGIIRMVTRNGTKVPVMTIQIGIDGYRTIAQRTGEYDSQDGPYWCGADGVWTDVWLDETKPPMAAKVGIRRKDSDGITYHVAKYSEFVQLVDRYEGEYPNRRKVSSAPNEMWAKMPSNQLAKCAEAGALRKACPQMARYVADVESEFEEVEPGYDVSIVRTPPRPIDRPQRKALAQPAEPIEIEVVADEDAPKEDGPLPFEPGPEEDDPDLKAFYVSCHNLGFDAARVKDFKGWATAKGKTKGELNAALQELAAIRKAEQG